MNSGQLSNSILWSSLKSLQTWLPVYKKSLTDGIQIRVMNSEFVWLTNKVPCFAFPIIATASSSVRFIANERGAESISHLSNQ